MWQQLETFFKKKRVRLLFLIILHQLLSSPFENKFRFAKEIKVLEYLYIPLLKDLKFHFLKTYFIW